MTTQPGLRERKKQRTRETISRAAHRLFAERGYHATTLPDIAEDLGALPEDLGPQLVAASRTAAFNLLYERDAGKKAKPRAADELATLLDPVFGFLRGGLDALRR